MFIHRILFSMSFAVFYNCPAEAGNSVYHSSSSVSTNLRSFFLMNEYINAKTRLNERLRKKNVCLSQTLLSTAHNVIRTKPAFGYIIRSKTCQVIERLSAVNGYIFYVAAWNKGMPSDSFSLTARDNPQSMMSEVACKVNAMASKFQRFFSIAHIFL